jgi:hypothetical protein
MSEPPSRTESGRFVPGVSGNPKGRPKRANDFSEVIRGFLEQPTTDGRTRLEELIERLWKEDPRTLLAYGFGKPVETHELSGPDGEPLIDAAVLSLAREVAKKL